jgi:hypothetical protein
MKVIRPFILLCALLSCVKGFAQNDTVVFSVHGGFYDEVFLLELNHVLPQNHIRYTLNGNRPTAQSMLYREPLVLDERQYSRSDIYTIQISPDNLVFVPNSVQHCIVIRAAAFDENDNCVSQVVTNSYFIHALGCDTHGLPVVSLCVDSLDLFGREQGILVPGVFFDSLNPQWTGNYYQSGRDWERLANMEFYEIADNTGINQPTGLRTHGGNARRGPQKGLKVYAREEYGAKRFRHKFFESIPHNSFKHLVLKPFFDEWFWAGIQNNICQRMARDINVESLATRPSVLFLNGEYWGIYTVSERPDAHYLEDHFGFDDEEINVIGNWHGLNENGDNTGFLQMMQWLNDADLSDEANYEYLCSLIDIDCFIDYYCLELFIANSDWPVNNMRCYQFYDRKWRWIFYDGDNGLQDLDFDVFGNATSTSNIGWPNDLKSTLMFRKLLENSGFKERFISRLNQLMEGPFGYENTKQYFEDAASLVREEVPSHALRFNIPGNLAQWEALIANKNHFLKNRVVDMNDKIANFFTVIHDSIVGDLICCYPNPFTEEIRISVEAEGFEAKEVVIYDLLGREVFVQPCCLNSGHKEIVLRPNVKSGVYLLKLGNLTMKIVKQ